MTINILQTVLIPRDNFTQQEASSWMVKNKIPIKKIDVKDNYYRYRQENPIDNAQYYSKKNKQNGIIFVYMYTL
jgi:hypothetical protein